MEELAEVHREILKSEPSEERRYRLAILELTLGRYAEAWPGFEHRPTRLPGAPKTNVPEWRGEPLAGKSIVVWHEQGLGDQIQMARFVPLLDAAQVHYACLPPLTRLFEQLCPTLPRLGEVHGTFDYWVSSLSLPLRCGATLDNLPPPAPFTATPRRAGRLGVCWRSSEATNRGRSLSPELAQELLSLPGAFSLHPEDTGAADFLDTAEMIAAADAVVSVDTSVAHLAGSMGKPVHVLLPTPCDWRWMRERADSPWYPTARLYRQETPGDWAPVVEAVKAAL